MFGFLLLAPFPAQPHTIAPAAIETPVISSMVLSGYHMSISQRPARVTTRFQINKVCFVPFQIICINGYGNG